MKKMKDKARQKRKKKKVVKWLSSPTDYEFAILYLLLGIYIAVATDVVISPSWFRFFLFSFILVVLLITFRIITFILALGTNSVKGLWTRWSQLCFIAICMILILFTNMDLRLRLLFSERKLYEEVEKVKRLSTDNQNQWLNLKPLTKGFFNVELYRVDSENQIFWFETGYGSNPFSSISSIFGGIVYCEQGEPLELGEATYGHLYGPWWKWLQDM